MCSHNNIIASHSLIWSFQYIDTKNVILCYINTSQDKTPENQQSPHLTVEVVRKHGDCDKSLGKLVMITVKSPF